MDKEKIKLFLDRHICLGTDKKIPFKEQIEIEKELYNIVEMYCEDINKKLPPKENSEAENGENSL